MNFKETAVNLSISLLFLSIMKNARMWQYEQRMITCHVKTCISVQTELCKINVTALTVCAVRQ